MESFWKIFWIEYIAGKNVLKKIIWDTAVMDVRSATSGMGIAEVKERARRTRSLEGSITLTEDLGQ